GGSRTRASRLAGLRLLAVPFTSVPRAAFSRDFSLRRHGFDRQSKGALLVRVHRTHADEFVGDYFAAIVTNRYHDRVFPRFAVGGMPNAAFDAQRRERRRLRRLDAGTE